MFNLLPQAEKKAVYELYVFRRLQLILVFFLAAGVIALVLLFPSFFIVQTKQVEIESEMDFRRISLARKDTHDLNVAILRAKEEIRLLEGVTKSAPTTYELFLKVIARKSDGIKVTSFLYGAREEENAIVVNGIARDRETLLTFAQDIGGDQAFSHVSLPVSNFAQNTDIEFSFTITGNF